MNSHAAETRPTSQLSTRVTGLRALIALVIVGLLVPVVAAAAAPPLIRTNYDAGDMSLWNQHGEQAKAADRITYVSDPLGQRGTVQRVEVRSGDNNVSGSGSGERAEVMTGQIGVKENQKLIVSWSTYIDSTFASPDGGWNNFVQLHSSGGTAQSPWQMNLVSDTGVLKMRLFGGGQWSSSGQPSGSVQELISAGTLPRNQWNDFVAEIAFNCSGSGYAKVWRNGSLIIDAQNRKVGYCGDPGTYWKQGFYRAAYSKTTKLWFDDTAKWSSTADAFAFFGWSGGSTPPPPAPGAPAPTAAPSVTGTAVQGGVLTASTGTWSGSPTGYAYQWQYSTDSGASWLNVSGATLQTFNLSSTFTGRLVRVQVTATGAGGSAAAASAAVGPIAAPVPAAPASTSAPVVTGTLIEGDTLSASTGSWSGSPTGYAYQWQSSTDGASWVSVGGATAHTLGLTSSLTGKHLRVQVTATNVGGSATAPSAGVGPVVAPAPVSTTPPVVSGQLREGSVVTVSNGSWAGSPSGYAYQWQSSADAGASWQDVAGANGSSLTLSAAIVGRHVRAQVTASSSGGSTTAASAAAGPVAALAPVSTGAPTVSGIPSVGRTLTASAGSWSIAPPAYVYQWQFSSDGGATWLNVTGAIDETLDLTASLADRLVRVQVTATSSGGSTTASSSAVGPVASPAPGLSIAPTVTGTLTEGNQLSATTGVWTGAPTAYAYQWQFSSDSGATWLNVGGATLQTFNLTATFTGKVVRVQVTASNASGFATALSAATGVIGPRSVSNVTAPAVSGSAVVGYDLTTTGGTWNGASSSPTFSWQRCTSAGTGCVAIAGATGSSYALAAADAGSRIRSVATVGGVSATSATSGVVAANLVVDPTVEQAGAPAYTTQTSGGFSWASDASHSTSHSLKVTRSSSSLTWWQTGLLPVAGKNYAFSVWAKSALSSGVGVLTVVAYSSSGKQISGSAVFSGSIQGSKDWTKLQIASASLPSGTAYVQLQMRVQGVGTVWFDDLVGSPA